MKRKTCLGGVWTSLLGLALVVVAVAVAQAFVRGDARIVDAEAGSQSARTSTENRQPLDRAQCATVGLTAYASRSLGIMIAPTLDRRGIAIGQREFVPDNFDLLGVPCDPTTTTGTHWRHDTFAVSFMPILIASRHGNEFYICGHPYRTSAETAWDASRFIVERWDLIPAEQSPFTSRNSATQPIGQAAPASRLTVGIAGNGYRMPQLRTAPEVSRVHIAELPFAVTAIEVDPGGRFLLLLDASHGVLYRKELEDLDAEAVAVLSAGNYPDLMTGTDLTVGRFASDGLKRFVVTCDSGVRILLTDGDNDALFEAVDVLTDQQYEAAGLLDMSGWAENYVTYALPGE